MHILGIANGSIGGNSEILLKAALSAALAANPDITYSWIHIPSVIVSRNPKPLAGSQDVSGGTNGALKAAETKDSEDDDRRAIWNHYLDADAFIYATPIYSRGPAGILKSVLDHILGPLADVTMATKILENRDKDPKLTKMSMPDPRLLKPRVAALIAVGGSKAPDQMTLVLPTIYQFVVPMHVKVVDQMVVQGAATPGAVLIVDDGAAIVRAETLGRNLVSQMGRSFDEAVFLGPASKSSCPYCHLDKIDLFYDNNSIGCIGCGAQGRLEVDCNGIIRPQWTIPSKTSSVTWEGKSSHIDHIWEHAAQEKQLIDNCADFGTLMEKWRNVKIPLAELPSNNLT